MQLSLITCEYTLCLEHFLTPKIVIMVSATVSWVSKYSEYNLHSCLTQSQASGVQPSLTRTFPFSSCFTHFPQFYSTCNVLCPEWAGHCSACHFPAGWKHAAGKDLLQPLKTLRIDKTSHQSHSASLSLSARLTSPGTKAISWNMLWLYLSQQIPIQFSTLKIFLAEVKGETTRERNFV